LADGLGHLFCTRIVGFEQAFQQLNTLLFGRSRPGLQH
jgi:hypothetical protein